MLTDNRFIFPPVRLSCMLLDTTYLERKLNVCYRPKREFPFHKREILMWYTNVRRVWTLYMDIKHVKPPTEYISLLSFSNTFNSISKQLFTEIYSHVTILRRTRADIKTENSIKKIHFNGCCSIATIASNFYLQLLFK